MPGTRVLDFDPLVIANPIDRFEDVVCGGYGYETSRVSDAELVVSARGEWMTYDLRAIWQPEQQAIHTSCQFEFKIKSVSLSKMHSLISEINAELWFGHFEVDRWGHLLIFRHTTLLRGVGQLTEGQIQDILEISVGQCDRFFPAFQMVHWGRCTPDKALQAALLETVGEA